MSFPEAGGLMVHEPQPPQRGSRERRRRACSRSGSRHRDLGPQLCSASGRALYSTNCANCHKENGTGGQVEIDGRKMKPDNLTDARRKGLSDEKILNVIVNGIEDEGMPAYKGKLSEGEMRDIVKFIRIELQKMPAQVFPKG